MVDAKFEEYYDFVQKQNYKQGYEHESNVQKLLLQCQNITTSLCCGCKL